VDFLLALIELFSPGVTSEALRANIGSKSAISPKQGQRPISHSSSQKNRLSDLSYVIKKSGLSQCTRLTDRQTDRRTDGQTDRRTDRILIAIDHICIPCRAVKVKSPNVNIIKHGLYNTNIHTRR